MSPISAIHSSVQGMNNNQLKMADHADRISRFGTGSNTVPAIDEVNLQEEMVGMMTAEIGYSANLQVFRIADEMQGSLLDVLA